MKVEFEDLTAETKRITKEIKEKSKKVQDLRYLLDRLQEEESDEDLTCVFTVDSLQKSSNSLPTIKPIPCQKPSIRRDNHAGTTGSTTTTEQTALDDNSEEESEGEKPFYGSNLSNTSQYLLCQK